MRGGSIYDKCEAGPIAAFPTFWFREQIFHFVNGNSLEGKTIRRGGEGLLKARHLTTEENIMRRWANSAGDGLATVRAGLALMSAPVWVAYCLLLGPACLRFDEVLIVRTSQIHHGHTARRKLNEQ